MGVRKGVNAQNIMKVKDAKNKNVSYKLAIFTEYVKSQIMILNVLVLLDTKANSVNLLNVCHKIAHVHMVWDLLIQANALCILIENI